MEVKPDSEVPGHVIMLRDIRIQMGPSLVEIKRGEVLEDKMMIAKLRAIFKSGTLPFRPLREGDLRDKGLL